MKDKIILVGVSGGIDSIVLCHLLINQNIPFEIAHVNYGLRGNESDADERFVRQFAADNNLVCHVKKLYEQEINQLSAGNLQANARDLRYAWFNEILGNTEEGYIMLAHHANDQAETILHRFFRGGMFPALRGMKSVRNNILRPLLEFKREDIVEYAVTMQLKWREDSSNAENKYTRNKLRNHIIPELSQIYPGLVDSLVSRTKIFSEAENLIHETMIAEKNKMLRCDDNYVRFSAETLAAHPYKTLLLWSIVRDYGFTAEQVDEIIKLIHSQSGKEIIGGQYLLIRDREDFIIAPHHESSEEVHIDKAEFSINKPISLEGKLVQRSEVKFDGDTSIAFIDVGKLKFPLKLRLWKEGDKFRPLGMTGHQKISDFLIQRKVNLLEKERVYVLTSENEIVWVCDMRLSEDYKITEQTSDVLRVRIRK